MLSSTITSLLPPKRTTALTDTMLGTATGSQGGYMRSVSTSATSVYVYVVALRWLVVPEVCIIALLLVIDTHSEVVVSYAVSYNLCLG
ncbi:hypothetical protein ARMGADRAFT_759757 [Armillaria gallica]|uniref:Uncharacterized protein n=1 Tax=Armillaria gallica TaxID=47427 RepID=A0A2H3DQ23_ARMGA|nr:hypothetical protein ARMGADRAFT_759757 [Armillaria gallica]